MKKKDLNLIIYFYMFIQTHFICFSLLYKDYEISKNVKFGGILIIFDFLLYFGENK